ncbi:HCL080Cp [Eremothecium sinecaudum]|uniref:Mediator of RNA polymerase II transcription subunit 5 n=1 Tax=Eremothecium sinecaudum TaxID=45286 RepID=A0A109UYN8_9SACH|nr:HCL080Cp [Eremothecium sinecaudum]AMD20071.1 HCL080Cp [Eremothecium sinecaudum]
MNMERGRELVYKLVLNCASRRISPKQFTNFYNEFINARFDSVIDGNSEDKKAVAPIYESIARDLLKLLNDTDLNLVADYIVELLFVNYNTELVKPFLPRLHVVKNQMILNHLFSKATAFIGSLSNKLILEQLSGDVYTIIIPGVMKFNFSEMDKQLVVSISKFLNQVVQIPQSVGVTDASIKAKGVILLKRLCETDKLLYKRISGNLETKLQLKESSSSFPPPPSAMPSPSVTSPKYESNVTTTSKQPSSASHEAKYQDVKLVRYYKNLWLNNKIHYFSVTDPNFLDKYESIWALVNENGSPQPEKSLPAKVTDLIETTFTCFAQFVNNKLYHQSNSYFNLLERKWTVFITKQLPLIIKKYVPNGPQAVVQALENIDDKVVNAIKSYNTETDEVKNRTEDLFDDFPANNLDIRHEFLKNLIMLGLQPPTVLNEFLREDQMVDMKSLVTTEHPVIENSQGVKETITDMQKFITVSIDALDFESLFDESNQLATSCDNGLLKLAHSLENIAPTKQEEMSNIMYNILVQAVEAFDHKKVSKILSIFVLNVGHILTNIFCFMGADRFVRIVVKFIDVIWENNRNKPTDIMSDESEFENVHSFMSYSIATAFIIHVVKVYGINLETFVEVPSKSAILKFLSKLGDISDEFNPNQSESSTVLMKQWLRDLFVNNSISDPLMKSADVKELGTMIPFIFKQTMVNVESGVISEPSNFINGFEYFLQPFMSIGLINIVFWLEQYLITLRMNGLFTQVSGNIFELLSVIISPKSINPDAKVAHHVILKLNCIGLLKQLKFFQVPNESNYGIYSSRSQQDPKLENLISSLEAIAQSAYFYDLDPRITKPINNTYPQKQISYNKLVLTTDLPVNKLLTNQINSFWNLHSSTYYNFDYLIELVGLVTPLNFMENVFHTLKYKVATYGMPGSSNKPLPGAVDQVLSFFFYFMVLMDIRCPEDKTVLLEFIENGKLPNSFSESLPEANNMMVSNSINTQQYEPKTEQELLDPADEDFDMLFGESFSGMPEESQKGSELKAESSIMKDEQNETPVSNYSIARLTESFGYIYFTSMNLKKEAYDAGKVSEEEYETFKSQFNKYVEILKRSII